MNEVLKFIKKYRTWIGAAIVIGAILFSVINRLFLRKPTATASPAPVASATQSPTVQSTVSPTTSTSPSPSSQNTIISLPLLFPDLDSANQLLYYLDPNDNQLKKHSLLDGTTSAIGELSAFVNYAVWSADHQELLLFMGNLQGNRVENPLYQDKLPYGETVVAHYTISSKKLDILNQNISTLAWLGSRQIIYQYQDNFFNNLSVSQSDGKQWRNLSKLQGDAEIISMGSEALVQIQGHSTVTRYKQDGGVASSKTVPADFKLSHSAWNASGQEALYWIKNNNQVAIHHMNDAGKTSLLTTHQTEQEDFAILWDNKNSDIYLASFDGLVKLGVKAGN